MPKKAVKEVNSVSMDLPYSIKLFSGEDQIYESSSSSSEELLKGMKYLAGYVGRNIRYVLSSEGKSHSGILTPGVYEKLISRRWNIVFFIPFCKQKPQ